MIDRKVRRSKAASTFSRVPMVQILPKLLCMTVFCGSFFKNHPQSTIVHPNGWKSPPSLPPQASPRQSCCRSEVKEQQHDEAGEDECRAWSSPNTPPGLSALGPETRRRQKNSAAAASAAVSLWTAAALRSDWRALTFDLWVILFYLPAGWFGCGRQVAAGICCVSPRLDAHVAPCRRTLSFALGWQEAVVQRGAFAEEEKAAGTDWNTEKRRPFRF